MTEFTETRNHAAPPFFNRIVAGCGPDNNNGGNGETDNTSAREPYRRTIVPAGLPVIASAFTATCDHRVFAHFPEQIVEIRCPTVPLPLLPLGVAAFIAALHGVAVLSVTMADSTPCLRSTSFYDRFFQAKSTKTRFTNILRR